jgi:nitrite reductase/ring-hydroxylating ferredoxin subunit
MKFPLCDIRDIPATGSKATGSKVVEFFGRQVHVYNVNGTPKAALSICTHFGGPLDYKDGKFVCQWHQAEFAMDDGHRLAAPAPANSRLMFLSTRIEDGKLTYVWGE